MVTQQQTQAMLTRFSSLMPRIRAATENSNETALRTPVVEGEWSAHNVLDHLRASYGIISYRIYAVLVRDNPPLPAFDERQWVVVANYVALPFHTSLETFARNREELLMMLQKLSPADWQRTGQHETRGTITLLAMMESLVEHEEEHCEQIEAMGMGD